MSTNATSSVALDDAHTFIKGHGCFDNAHYHRYFASPEVQTILDRWHQHRKACDSCGAQTQLSELNDITTCGDWLTVCLACLPRFRK